MPTAQELAEQVFQQQPKAHQEKHSAENKELGSDLEKLTIKGCHPVDLSNGTYTMI